MQANLTISQRLHRHNAIYWGGVYTLIISPYLILFLILVIATGNSDAGSSLADTLAFAGRMPVAYQAAAFADGLFHVLFFVTAATIFARTRNTWPVQAGLILVFGALQMFSGFLKGLFLCFTFPDLGTAYLSADAANRLSLLPVAQVVDNLRNALQWLDSLGVMWVWILVALLPAAAGLPRPARWIAWVLAAAILAPDPAFLLVLLLAPIWLFLVDRWLVATASSK